MINIVSGPRGCGKTYHAEKIKAHFKATRVVDGWTPGEPLQDGDVALTNWYPPATGFDFNTLPGPIYSFRDLARKNVVTFRPYHRSYHNDV